MIDKTILRSIFGLYYPVAVIECEKRERENQRVRETDRERERENQRVRETERDSES